MANRLGPIALPLLGLNTVDPFNIGWNSGYARELTNWAICDGQVCVRPGIESIKFTNAVIAPAPALSKIMWFDVSSPKDAIYNEGTIVDLDAGTSPGNIGGTPLYNPTTVQHLNLNFVIGLRQPRLAASPFTAWTFTTIGITATSIVTACSYKGRLYVADDNTIEYSSVGAVTGALVGSFPLSSLLGGQRIYRIVPLTVFPGDATKNVFMIFGSAGKVLVYEGDYPGSATWSLIANYDMPTPISNVAFQEIDGDIFVAGNEYCYWARDLFSGGQQTAYTNSPTQPIENVWKATFPLWPNSYLFDIVVPPAFVFYHPDLDAIIIKTRSLSLGNTSLQTIASYFSDGSLYYVYYRKYRAWSVWYNAAFWSPVQILQSTKKVYGVAYGRNINFNQVVSYTDGLRSDEYVYDQGGPAVLDSIDIETSWKTPDSERTEGLAKKLNGVRLFYKSLGENYVEKLRAIFDYSDFNSAYGWYTQSMVFTPVLPGNYNDSSFTGDVVSWAQYHPVIGVAGHGGNLSIQFTYKKSSGSPPSATVSPFAIYGANAMIEDGGETF